MCGEFAHRVIVRRIADVVDVAAGDAVLVGDDLHQRRDAVVDVGESALLLAAIDQLDRLAAHDVAEELGDHTRAAFLRRVDGIESRADPVEGTEQRVVQPFLLTVPGDDAVHQLFGAGVDPARLVDRAVDQLRVIRIELAVLAHAIDFGCGGEDHAFAVFHAVTHDRQIGLEIEFEDAQGFLHVGGRRGDRHQRQHGVALLDVVGDPLLVDRDVAFEEMKSPIVEQVRYPFDSACPCHRRPSRWCRVCAWTGGGR